MWVRMRTVSIVDSILIVNIWFWSDGIIRSEYWLANSNWWFQCHFYWFDCFHNSMTYLENQSFEICLIIYNHNFSFIFIDRRKRSYLEWRSKTAHLLSPCCIQPMWCCVTRWSFSVSGHTCRTAHLSALHQRFSHVTDSYSGYSQHTGKISNMQLLFCNIVNCFLNIAGRRKSVFSFSLLQCWFIFVTNQQSFHIEPFLSMPEILRKKLIIFVPAA